MRATRRVIATAMVMALAAIPFMSAVPGCAEHKDAITVIPAAPLPDLQQAGLKTMWERQVALDPGEGVKKAWRVGASVYMATTQSRLARIDANSGVLVWCVGLGEANFDIYKPIELKPADGPARQVLVVTRGDAFLLDMSTGDMARPPAPMGLSVSANPVLIGNTLCVGGAGRFFGLFLDRPGSVHWRMTAPGELFTSSPVAVDSSVVVASSKGRLWRLNAENGDWIWKDRKTNGDVVAGLAADSRAVYIPCLDQRVYAFAVDTGAQLWEQQLSGVLDVTPSLGGEVVMVISESEGIYGLSRLNGEIKWHVPGVWQVATVGDNAAWVGDHDGMLKLLSLETGEVLKSASAEGVHVFVRNADDQSLFLVTRSGVVGRYMAK